MAKDFRYKTNESWCLDPCKIIPSAFGSSATIKIGSMVCRECKHNKGLKHKLHLINCSKIIYRHYSGLVVMRKK